jgi:hypothetical protein
VVKVTLRSQLNGGFGADFGPSRGDCCRRAIRPFLPFGERATGAESRQRVEPLGQSRERSDRLPRLRLLHRPRLSGETERYQTLEQHLTADEL